MRSRDGRGHAVGSGTSGTDEPEGGRRRIFGPSHLDSSDVVPYEPRDHRLPDRPDLQPAHRMETGRVQHRRPEHHLRGPRSPSGHHRVLSRRRHQLCRGRRPGLDRSRHRRHGDAFGTTQSHGIHRRLDRHPRVGHTDPDQRQPDHGLRDPRVRGRRQLGSGGAKARHGDQPCGPGDGGRCPHYFPGQSVKRQRCGNPGVRGRYDDPGTERTPEPDGDGRWPVGHRPGLERARLGRWEFNHPLRGFRVRGRRCKLGPAANRGPDLVPAFGSPRGRDPPLPGQGGERQRRRALDVRGERHHVNGNAAGATPRPEGDRRQFLGDRAELERPSESRQQRDHRLSDRVVEHAKRRMERSRGQHARHAHHLPGHWPLAEHDPLLPGLRDQLLRHGRTPRKSKTPSPNRACRMRPGD